MSTKPYWMLSRPQRKLYRIPLTVAALFEATGEERWQGGRKLHIAFEEILEREKIKRVGIRRDRQGSGGRTHAALVRSLGFAFDSSETGKLELTLAGIALLEGQRPSDVLKNQVMRFQYPSPYSISPRVNIDARFRLRPFVLLLKLLLDPRLEHWISDEEIALLVILKGVGDSDAATERVVEAILDYRENGVDESAFLATYGKPSDTFEKLRDRFRDIANTSLNWLEVTGVISRESGRASISAENIGEATQLVNSYGELPLIKNHEDVDRFQRTYGLPPGKQKDMRNLSATKQFTKADFIRRRVLTIVTGWSATELLIDGADNALIARLADKTSFSLEEVALAARDVVGADRSLDTYLTHYQSLVYSTEPSAPREFERATAEIFRRVFDVEVELVGQRGREPDIIVRSPNHWRGIVDTKAYSSDYTLPAAHDRAMREYVERYVNLNGEKLRFWAFIAGTVSPGASHKAKALAQQVGTPGVVIGLLAWIQLIRLGQAGAIDANVLAGLFAQPGEITLESLTNLGNSKGLHRPATM